MYKQYLDRDLHQFEDLHHYLQECYNCLKANLEFAGTIMIRPCLHIFLKFYNKNNQEKKEVKIIENFIKEIIMLQ